MAKLRVIKGEPSEAVCAAASVMDDTASVACIQELIKTAVANWRLRNWYAPQGYTFESVIYRTNDRGAQVNETVGVLCASLGFEELHLNPDGEIRRRDERGRFSAVEPTNLTPEERQDLIDTLEAFAR